MNKTYAKFIILGFFGLTMCNAATARPFVHTSTTPAPKESQAKPAPAQKSSSPTAIAPREKPTRSHVIHPHRGQTPSRHGNVTVIVDNGPSEAELEIERQQLELQKANDRAAWEILMKDRDQVLQEEAYASDDGKCINYFCGIRCQRRSSNEGLCARHFRELDKGLKDQLYRQAACNRYP